MCQTYICFAKIKVILQRINTASIQYPDLHSDMRSVSYSEIYPVPTTPDTWSMDENRKRMYQMNVKVDNDVDYQPPLSSMAHFITQ